VSSSFEALAKNLGDHCGNVQNEYWSTSEGRTAVILGESYFFRTNGNAAILMILKEVGASETNLELVSYAGASGLVEVSCGTQPFFCS